MTNYIQLQAIDEQSDLSNMQMLTGVEVNSEAIEWCAQQTSIILDIKSVANVW